MSIAGRFAPSPTGSLHLGSLLAAVGSWLDARSRGGHWLLRIEHLDLPRNLPGAEAQICATLHAFGLDWDGELVRQSARGRLYAAALQELADRGLLFHCDCSRRLIAQHAGADSESRCVGNCRYRPVDPADAALRAILDRGTPLGVLDRGGERLQFDPRRHTDVVVRRRDGIIAYQLAVIVDDAAQGVTDVVRGADLADSTPWQLGLQRALGLEPPRYLHLPLVTEPDGSKLAKSRRSVPVDAALAGATVVRCLHLLRQSPPAGLENEPVQDVLDWGRRHWRPEAFHGIRMVRA